MKNDSTQGAPKPRNQLGDQLKLGVIMGPDAGRSIVVAPRASATIGALPENDLSLRDPTVSRVHLEVRPVEDGVAVRDLGSLNGTYLGNVRIQEGIVPPGTRIRVGSTLFVVELITAGAPEADVGSATPSIPGLVYASPPMAEVARAVERLAKFAGPVLIQGETGTGKEVIAHALHELGPRKRAPFVLVDCGSLPATLLEAELFGHERGAFTGAERRALGAFERANGGTLFLDEIGELPLAAQPALLGVLERGRFRRVGGEAEVEVDVRVISATNRDLRAEVNRAAFRSDLYYRLAGARIIVPPLRERREDIPVLAAHFVEEAQGSSPMPPFPPEMMDELAEHYWSGNVRELRNAVEAALAMGRFDLDPAPGSGATQGSASVPPTGSVPPPGSEAGPIPDYKAARAQVLSGFERTYLTRLMTKANGNASEAARVAKMDRPYLLTLLRKHGLR
jgi:transcriptional regulator with GAF, ATPase, and Fis domain